jgi:hypothetical protein
MRALVLFSLFLSIQPFFSTCYALCNIRNQKRASEHLCEEAAQHFAHVGELTTAAGILLVACIRTPPWMGGIKKKKKNLTVFGYFVGWERKVFSPVLLMILVRF